MSEEHQLRQQYAGQAMNGMMASSIWSKMLTEIAHGKSEEQGHPSEIFDIVAKISWITADRMIIEGRERGFIDS